MLVVFYMLKTVCELLISCWSSDVASSDLPSRLDDGLRQFLDEGRHPFGPGQDRLDDLVRQGPSADHARDQRLDLAPGKPVQSEKRDVREADPGRRQLQPEGDDKQHPEPTEDRKRPRLNSSH